MLSIHRRSARLCCSQTVRTVARLRDLEREAAGVRPPSTLDLRTAVAETQVSAASARCRSCLSHLILAGDMHRQWRSLRRPLEEPRMVVPTAPFFLRDVELLVEHDEVPHHRPPSTQVEHDEYAG